MIIDIATKQDVTAAVTDLKATTASKTDLKAAMDDLKLFIKANASGPAPVPVPTVVAKIGTVSYNSLADAATAAKDGDIVLIQPGKWLGLVATAAFTTSVTIEGVKGADGLYPELHVDGTIRPAWGKAVINAVGAKIWIKNLIVSGCHVPDSNGAGVRCDVGCQDLTLDNIVFKDNENGFLGGNPGGFIRFNACKFVNNGDASDPSRQGYAHNAYVGNAARVEFNNCETSGSKYGHEIKSRAVVTIVNGCKVTCGINGRAIDLPNGGTLKVTSSNLYKGADALQGQLMGIGQEGITNAPESYTFTQSVFTNQRSSGSKPILANASTVPGQFSACTFVGSNEFSGPFTIV